MEKLSVRDLEVKGRRVLVRVDFNLPTKERDGNIRITEDTRIRESSPTNVRFFPEEEASADRDWKSKHTVARN